MESETYDQGNGESGQVVTTDVVPTGERGPDGRFVPGNAAALKHGRRSARAQAAMLPGQEAIRAELEARVAEVVADLGGDAECSRLKRDAVRSDARLFILEETLWADIERNGAMTTKGKRRAATTALLNIVDRRLKLAALLGLERREKRARTVAELMANAPSAAPAGSQEHER